MSRPGILSRVDSRLRDAPGTPETPPAAPPPLTLSTPEEYAELLACTFLLCEMEGWQDPRRGCAGMTLCRPATLLQRLDAWTRKQATAAKASPSVTRAIQNRTTNAGVDAAPARIWFYTTVSGILAVTPTTPLYLLDSGEDHALRHLQREELVVGVTLSQYQTAIRSLRDAEPLPDVAFATGNAIPWRRRHPCTDERPP